MHPLWVLSLVVLLVNDHHLKGAGIAPAWLAGKLSDVAGWFLFPMLLATALRARTRAAALGAHLMSAALLLALELSPGLCALVERTLGVRSWADPTDLVALASIAASWWLLVPVAERGEPARRLLSRSLAVVGGVASMATSPPAPVPSNPTQFVEAFLWNRSDSDIQVRVSAPRQEVELSCDEVLAQGPAALMRTEHFRVVRNVVLVAGGRVSLDGFARGSCSTLLLNADGAEPRLVAWKVGTLGKYEIGNSPVAGVGVELKQDALSRTLSAPSGYHLSPLAPLAAPQGASCDAPPPFGGVAWGEPIPVEDKPYTLLSVKRGEDGCDALKLSPEGGGPTLTWFLCVDPLPLPLVAGEVVTFRRPQGTLVPGVVAQSAGGIVTAMAGTGFDIAGLPSCMPLAHDCVVGTERQLRIATPAGSLVIAPGDLKVASGGGYRVTAHATRAEMVYVADQGCDTRASIGFQESFAWVAKKEMP